jgi:putative hemolysin
MEVIMNQKKFAILALLMGSILSASCRSIQTNPTTESKIPNPASVFCVQNDGKLELRQDAAGGVAGICVFPDGSECEEWAYFRKECKPGDSLMKPVPATVIEIASDGWKIYRNEELGYSFHYPVNTKISMNDEPLKSISIVPEKDGEGWPSIGISHPRDREEYRPPEGTDLLKWLTDHNLLGEVQSQSIQIAGTTAIHFRHERSPQSYAFDSYFFTHADQLYMITIGHTEDKEDWELYNHFLESFKFEK